MNNSYKIVLLGAFVLFVAVIGYYVLSGSDEPAELTANPPSETDPPTAPPVQPEPADPTPPARPSLPTEQDPDRIVTIDPILDPADPLDIELAPPCDPIDIESGELFDPLALGGDPVAPAPPIRPDLEPGGDLDPEPTNPEPDPLESIFEPEPQPEPEPVRPVPPAPRRDTPRTYTVQAGDMLSTIAVKVYGEERAWFDIAQANPSVDPRQLQVGQVLVLPNRDAPPDTEEVRPPVPGADQTYTVRPGDNLSKIAQRFYKDSEAWDLIYARNRAKIGPRPDAIKVGMELIIPQAYDGAE